MNGRSDNNQSECGSRNAKKSATTVFHSRRRLTLLFILDQTKHFVRSEMRAAPSSFVSSIRNPQPTTVAPARSTNGNKHRSVPPVANRSSIIRIFWPGLKPSRCTSSDSVPYSVRSGRRGFRKGACQACEPARIQRPTQWPEVPQKMNPRLRRRHKVDLVVCVMLGPSGGSPGEMPLAMPAGRDVTKQMPV